MSTIVAAPQIEVDDHNAGTLARARAYALFADCFRHPQQVGDSAADGRLPSALETICTALPFRYTFVGTAPTGDARALGMTYTSLFDTLGRSPVVPLLERQFAGRLPEQQLWEELLRFYRHFGLDFSEAGPRESPDHLLVELEFMQYLCFLEAGATDDASVQSLRRGQRDFLERHLVSWLGGLTEALTQAQEPAPFDLYAEALARFTAADLMRLQSAVDESGQGDD